MKKPELKYRLKLKQVTSVNINIHYIDSIFLQTDHENNSNFGS